MNVWRQSRLAGRRLTLAIVFTLGIGIVASQNARAEVTNFPNGISSFGMTVIPNVGGEVYSGNVWFVDSGDNNGSDNAHEPGNRLEPYSTLDAAIDRSGVVSGANNGDVILVLPGHTETISTAGIDLDIAGLTVIGIGNGDNRPTITFSNSTATSDMDIDAANITIQNLLFVASTATAPIDVNAADFTMINCETRDSSVNFDAAGSATNWIVADKNSDRMKLINHRHVGTDTAPSAIQAGATISGLAPSTFLQIDASTDTTIIGGYFYGNFHRSIFEGTGTNSLRLRIYGTANNPMFLWNENGNDSLSSMTAATTGFFGPNVMGRIVTDGASLSDAIGAVAMQFMRPIQLTNAVNEVAGTESNYLTVSTQP